MFSTTMRSVSHKGPGIGSRRGPGVVQARSRRAHFAVTVTECRVGLQAPHPHRPASRSHRLATSDAQRRTQVLGTRAAQQGPPPQPRCGTGQQMRTRAASPGPSPPASRRGGCGPGGQFRHGLISVTTQTSKGTFLSLAAPVPERMASIKACLASTRLLRGSELELAVVRGAEGAGGG